MPDYNRHTFDINPSDKPLTEPHKPNFASDKIPKKPKKIEIKEKSSPPDFKF